MNSQSRPQQTRPQQTRPQQVRSLPTHVIESILLETLQGNTKIEQLGQLKTLSLVTKSATNTLKNARKKVVQQLNLQMNKYMVLDYFNDFISGSPPPPPPEYESDDNSNYSGYSGYESDDGDESEKVVKRFRLYLYDYKDKKFVYKELEVKKKDFETDAKEKCKKAFNALLKKCVVIIALPVNGEGSDFTSETFYPYNPNGENDIENIFNVIRMYIAVFEDSKQSIDNENTKQIIDFYCLYLITFILRFCLYALAIDIKEKEKISWAEIKNNQRYQGLLENIESFCVEQGIEYLEKPLDITVRNDSFELPDYVRYLALFYVNINVENKNVINTSYIGKNECRHLPECLKRKAGGKPKKAQKSSSSKYVKTTKKHNDKNGKQYVIYKKGDKSYIKKKSKKTGKFTYRGISP